MKFRHKFGLMVAYGWMFTMCFMVMLTIATGGDVNKPYCLYFNTFHEFYPEFIVSIIGFICLIDYLIHLIKTGEFNRGARSDEQKSISKGILQ